MALTVPVFVLEMGGHLPDLHQWLGQQTSNWIQLVLATPVVLWAGWPFFERALDLAQNAQSQHVHADRHGHRRGVGLQHRRHPAAGRVPGGDARP